MKGRTLSVLGIFALAIGAVLILCHQSISLEGVTITCGILFVAVGLVNLLLLSSGKTAGAVARVLTLLANASSIVLGVSMLVFRATFVPMIAFMFGLLIAVCALWQFFVLAVGTRPHILPAWLYLFPVALVGGSAYSFFIKGPDTDALVLLVTGIAMCVTGVACLIEGSALGVARRRYQREQAAAMHPAISHQPATDIPVDEPDPLRRQRPETTDDLDDEIQTPLCRQRPETTDDLDDEIQTPHRRQRPETTDDLDDEIR